MEPRPQLRHVWTAKRKHALVVSIRRGLVDRLSAMAEYQISEEEMQAWERDSQRGGETALKVANISRNRRGLHLV